MTRIAVLLMLLGHLGGCVTPSAPPQCDGPYTPINNTAAAGPHEARSAH